MDITLGTFTGTILLGFLAWKGTSLTKYVSAGQFREVITQLLAVAWGIAAVFLVGATEWAGETVVGNLPLTDIDTPGKVAVGVIVGATGSVLYDFKKSRDNTDTASEPALLPKVGMGSPADPAADGQP